MANVDVIKSYLVSLGYEIDAPQLQKFNDALRGTAQQVEKFTSGMTTAFVEAGVAVVTALTGIATGTIALMESTARADLSMQLLARRMYMGVDAARQMQTSLKTLGVELSDVIWGPPELRERYHQLIADQKQLLQATSGPEAEAQFRRIRDVTFEFDRMKVSAGQFVRVMVSDLSKALTGDEDSLLNKLRGWNEWLLKNIPRLADEFSTYLVPVLRDVKAIWTDVADIMKIVTEEFIAMMGSIYDDKKLKSGTANVENLGRAMDHVAHSVQTVVHWVDVLVNLLHKLEIGKNMEALVPGFEFGKWMWNKMGITSGAVPGGDAATTASASTGISQQDVKAAIVAAAKMYGVDPALALATAQGENNFQQFDKYGKVARGAAGEYGMMQLMPETIRSYGGDPMTMLGNLDIGMRKLRDLSRLHPGDPFTTLERYMGSGPVARQHAAERLSQAQQGFDVGGVHVTINVNQPGASAQEIGEHAAKAVHSELKKISQRQIVQAGNSYA